MNTLKALLILLAGLYYSTSLSQVIDDQKNYANLPKQYYYLNPLVYYAKDSKSARVVIYMEFLTGELQFKKNQTTQKFDSNIEYTIVIKSNTDSIVFNETYKETFSRNDEEMKALNGISEYRFKYTYINPGLYKIYFSLRDRNNYTEYKSEYGFYVQDYGSKQISLSSIMLLSDYKSENDKKSITPLVSNNIGDLNDMFVFFEIYNLSDNTIPISLNYKIYGDKKTVLKEGTFSYILKPGVNQEIEKIPSNDLSIGTFLLDFSSKIYQDLIMQQPFEFRWTEISVNISDLDKVIDQMLYIAPSEDLDFIKAATSKGDKEKRFLRWWKDHDPSPKTPRNELMIEYYSRVKYATEKWSTTYTEGWRTDMGMVYILFGMPSNIDRHPFDDSAKPYEIWEYYDLNRQFVFVDYTGFGDYRLTTPIYDKRFKL